MNVLRLLLGGGGRERAEEAGAVDLGLVHALRGNGDVLRGPLGLLLLLHPPAYGQGHWNGAGCEPLSREWACCQRGSGTDTAIVISTVSVPSLR